AGGGGGGGRGGPPGRAGGGAGRRGGGRGPAPRRRTPAPPLAAAGDSARRGRAAAREPARPVRRLSRLDRRGAERQSGEPAPLARGQARAAPVVAVDLALQGLADLDVRLSPPPVPQSEASPR